MNHWADVCFEPDTGWYIKATKIGEKSKNCLKIIFKNYDEWYDEKCDHNQSQFLLI